MLRSSFRFIFYVPLTSCYFDFDYRNLHPHYFHSVYIENSLVIINIWKGRRGNFLSPSDPSPLQSKCLRERWKKRGVRPRAPTREQNGGGRKRCNGTNRITEDIKLSSRRITRWYRTEGEDRNLRRRWIKKKREREGKGGRKRTVKDFFQGVKADVRYV